MKGPARATREPAPAMLSVEVKEDRVKNVFFHDLGVKEDGFITFKSVEFNGKTVQINTSFLGFGAVSLGVSPYQSTYHPLAYLCPLGDYPCEPDPDNPDVYYCVGEEPGTIIPTDEVDLTSGNREDADFVTKECSEQIVCIDPECSKTEIKEVCNYCFGDYCWDNDYEDNADSFGEALAYMEIAAEIGQDYDNFKVFNGFKETCVTKGGIIFTVDCCDELGSNAEDVGTAINSIKYAFGAYKYLSLIHI